MPLSAVVEGRIVCAPLLDEEAWAMMRTGPVTLTCGHPGFGRTSPLGTQHFVHVRDSGCGHAESAEHLHLKACVARSVAAAGWAACTEAPGPGFVADVLAARGSSRVAFEVQRSRQVLREYERRQARYAEAGIRCVWLVKDVPAGHESGPDLPLFTVSRWDDEPEVVVSGRSMAVSELVPALLCGRCRWRPSVTSMRALRETMQFLCPMCGTRREVETARWLSGECPCGLPVLRLGHAAPLAERGSCCGYWGPGLAVGRHTRSRTQRDDIACGHWCLSA